MMWQTGRAADRHNDRKSPAPEHPQPLPPQFARPQSQPKRAEHPRKDTLPQIEPATSGLGERIRGFCLIAGSAARWVLAVLILIVAGAVLLQNGAVGERITGTSVATWAKLAVGLAMLAASLHLRFKIGMGLRALVGGNRADKDPFARLAAQTRAQPPECHAAPVKQRA
ncbi:CopD family protein [Phaeovulum sp.]|uniref:CopD family protein n=1 Tax=Phaeovulum sp. TaxID=2934796 RepID=UPI00272FD102|nr:CopD family protein [Phaeovulum sp.]MDP1669504.1 CopD family protein [Phaeovulum sp.]MDZ4119777.1 CopD family protein [Phaeovulum sp.]